MKIRVLIWAGFTAATVACSGLGKDYTFVDSDAAAEGGTDAGDASAKGDARADGAGPDGASLCPDAKINHPSTEPRMVGTDVVFVGTGRDVDCNPIIGSKLVWVDSLEGKIGQTETFIVQFSTLGTHTVTLTATGRSGATATASVTFDIF